MPAPARTDHRAARASLTIARVYEADADRCASALVWLLESRASPGVAPTVQAAVKAWGEEDAAGYQPAAVVETSPHQRCPSRPHHTTAGDGGDGAP
jgi:hypothetical protein